MAEMVVVEVKEAMRTCHLHIWLSLKYWTTEHDMVMNDNYSTLIQNKNS